MRNHSVHENNRRRLLAWDQRPLEIAYLLNPAFCILVLNEAIRNYQETRSTNNGMPYPLSFLILPLVLHRKTRELLPKKISKDLYDWLQENPVVYSGYADRIRRLAPLTKEAIIFGVQRQIIGVDQQGNLISSFTPSSYSADKSAPDLSLYLKSAGLIGRWFASFGSVETIYRTWRIRP
jgi:hypothetical protein